MVLERIRTIPAWVVSVALHVALFAMFAGLVVRQAKQEVEKPPVSFRIAPRPAPPQRPAEKPAPAREAAEEAPLPMEAPVDDHNETANEDDERTARLAETIGIGGGFGPAGRGGRRYTRSDGGRRGANSARAVEEGLEWLARHQSREGHWGMHTERCEKGRGSCSNIPGNGSRRMAITALALLAFLANGEGPSSGPHAQNVRRGLEYLLAHQSKQGRFESSYPIDDYYSLYEQAISTWAFAEATAATGDAKYRDAATRAVENLDRRVTMRADTSVMGFVVMALRSAECAGVKVPPKAKEWGPKYFQVLVERKGDFAYRIEEDLGKPPLSDIGIYASLLYGLQEANPKVKKAIDAALAGGSERASVRADGYYHGYYWTLAYLLAGGERWKTWDASMRDELTGQQERSGCPRGSWAPDEERISNRVLSTSLAVLTLHVCDQKLLLHRAASAAPEAERVGVESMAFGETLWEEALRACARTANGGDAREALAQADAFLAWTTKAEPETDADRRALSEWTRDVQETAAEVAARSGDTDGALDRLARVADPTPGALVLRGTILARRVARERDAEAADRLRREAIEALVAGLGVAPSREGDVYRLVECLVRDLRGPLAVEALHGSLVWLAVEQGALARETRRVLETRGVPGGLAERLGRARDTGRSARRRHPGLSALFDEWERDTLLSIARVALVGGRAEDAEKSALEAARVCPRRSTDRDVVSLLGAASLKAATSAWNAGDRRRAAEHARVGASAYAYIASLDPKEGARLAEPIADLFFMAGEHREAARRYRVALARVVQEMGDPANIRAKLDASCKLAGEVVVQVR